jgi:hypothetical protein
MIVSNITISVEPKVSDVFEDILTKFASKQSPENRVDFISYKLLTEINTENITYAVQFSFKSISEFEVWDFSQKHEFFKYLDLQIPNTYVYFQTLLQRI